MHCDLNKSCYTKPTLYLIAACIFVLFSWDKQRLLLAQSFFTSTVALYPALSDTPLPDKNRHTVALDKIHFVTPLGMLSLKDISDEMLVNLRNQIMPIDNPQFISADENKHLKNEDIVIGYNDDNEAWAFPIKILNHREIVNATLNEKSLLVTYCPLCGSGVVYNRKLNDETLYFGNSHGLYESDMVMFDYQTGSLWQQITGTALVGLQSKKTLTTLPSMTTTWESWNQLYPDSKILITEYSTLRPFNSNGYRNALNHGKFHASGVNQSAKDNRLAAGSRVMAIKIGQHTYVYPLPEKFETKLAMQHIENQSLLITIHGRGGMIFDPIIDNQSLNFELVNGWMRDKETQSLWSFSGLALSGPRSPRRWDHPVTPCVPSSADV